MADMDEKKKQSEAVKEAVKKAEEEAKAKEDKKSDKDNDDKNNDSQAKSDNKKKDSQKSKDSKKELEKESEDKEEKDTDSKEEESKEESSDDKDKGKKKKDKKDEEIADLKDRLTRQIAEFDNYRKRTEKEKAHMYQVGAKEIIEKILPIVDNFERGLEGIDDNNKDDPFVSGMEMIYKQLMTSLEDMGVTPIPAVGETFNPDLHNAVMHEEDSEQGENIIVEELQKGYKYKDMVIRYSMVKVVN